MKYIILTLINLYIYTHIYKSNKNNEVITYKATTVQRIKSDKTKHLEYLKIKEILTVH